MVKANRKKDRLLQDTNYLTLPEGWSETTCYGKRHYYEYGQIVSLCKRFVDVGNHREKDAPDSFENCHRCRMILGRRQRACLR